MKANTASVIVATLNEEKNITHVVEVAAADPRVKEIIIADGGSSDLTRSLVEQLSQDESRLRLVDNPDRHQSAGLNRAASIASGDYLVRLDAHTKYASDYVAVSLDTVDADTAVGGPMRAEGHSPWAEATANAMQDPLAIGPARFHHAESPENVDTVYLGTFLRAAFLDLGGYRTFPSGTVEDTDFYARWRASGRRVLVDPAIESDYLPRESWGELARQYFRYGLGKAELIWLNGRLPSLRPLAPSLLVLGIAITVLAALVWSPIPLAALLIAWGAALAVVAVRAPSQKPRTAAVAATMHLSYGSGLWVGLLSGRPSVVTRGLEPVVASDRTNEESNEEDQ